jgi:perosamine synthetase
MHLLLNLMETRHGCDQLGVGVNLPIFTKIKSNFDKLNRLSCKVIRGKREISLFFTTLTIFDTFVAFWLCLKALFGPSNGFKGRNKFLEIVKQDIDYQEAYLYGSARSALYGLLKSMKLDRGSEVIVTGFTCEVVPNAVIQAGHTPVYADIEMDTLGLCPDSVRSLITGNTKAIIIQHTFGIPAKLDKLLQIADEYSLFVIEDCAVSLGTQYKGKLTGTFGDAAIFSFELSKTITCCWGGLLVLNSNRDGIVQAQNQFYQLEVPESSRFDSGWTLFQLGLSALLYQPRILPLGKILLNYLYISGIFRKSTSLAEEEAQMAADYLKKLSAFQAEFLCRQWPMIEKITAKSQILSKFYEKELADINGVQIFPNGENRDENRLRYPILVEKRDRVIEYFKKNEIPVGLWFTAPLSSTSVNHELFGYRKNTCPRAEEISEKILNLPLHLQVTTEECERILACLRK